jgi:hypothetical protein
MITRRNSGNPELRRTLKENLTNSSLSEKKPTLLKKDSLESTSIQSLLGYSERLNTSFYLTLRFQRKPLCYIRKLILIDNKLVTLRSLPTPIMISWRNFLMLRSHFSLIESKRWTTLSKKVLKILNGTPKESTHSLRTPWLSS